MSYAGGSGVASPTMTEAFLDTTFFVDLLHGHEGAERIWETIASQEVVGYFSSVTVTELWMGKLSSPQEQRFFNGLFDLLVEVPLSRMVAEMAGETLRPLDRFHARRLLGDALIGCTALSLGLSIYSNNVKDMSLFAATVRRY